LFASEAAAGTAVMLGMRRRSFRVLFYIYIEGSSPGLRAHSFVLLRRQQHEGCPLPTNHKTKTKMENQMMCCHVANAEESVHADFSHTIVA